jgi:hypothetical protein
MPAMASKDSEYIRSRAEEILTLDAAVVLMLGQIIFGFTLRVSRVS